MGKQFENFGLDDVLVEIDELLWEWLKSKGLQVRLYFYEY
jgi:hypothetical protein